MTYVFPPSLHPLRDYLRGQGADICAFVSARQTAFMAQQLLGSRVKFPDKGADMTSTLFLIQKAVTEGGAKINPDPLKKPAKGKKPKAKSAYANFKKDKPDFRPQVFAEGVHIFCDGSSIPNPGVGGWGVVVYDNGQELRIAFGGDPQTTNNQMELTGLLNAIEQAKALSDNPAVTIWCDSQYSVNGANDWRHKWKRNGWKKSPAATEHVKNADLWKAIDEALSNTASSGISIKWVKGHADIAGNERADQLAEQGRQQVLERGAVEVGLVDEVNELDARFRQIMGAE